VNVSPKTLAILIDVPQTGYTDVPFGTASEAVELLESYLCREGVPAQNIHRLSGRVSYCDVRHELDLLSKKCQSGDTVVLMFAGHGLEEIQQGHETTYAWALWGCDKVEMSELKAKFDSLDMVRWIVVSDCCYGAKAFPQTSFSWSRLWRKLFAGLMRRLSFKIVDDDDYLRKAARGAVDALRPKASILLAGVFIGIAGATGTVSMGGEWLLALSVVGCAANGLPYTALQREFDLVHTSTSAFVLQCSSVDEAKPVLSWVNPSSAISGVVKRADSVCG